MVSRDSSILYLDAGVLNKLHFKKIVQVQAMIKSLADIFWEGRIG